MSAARHLQEALSASAAGADLLQRFAASQRAAQAISSECQRIVPDLEPTRCGVCDLRGGTLRVNAVSASQLAKLRQAIPRLLAQLRRQGLDVSEIKLGIQPRPLSSSDRGAAHLEGASGADGLGDKDNFQLNRKAAQEFASKLALAMPDSDLGQAARRLLKTLSRGVARTRD